MFSRNLKNARALAEKINVLYTDCISEINKEADLYVISVADCAVSDLISLLNVGKSIVVHTSGSLDINLLNRFPDHGVFYPLQTFSINKPVEFKNIPLLIEANSDDITETLKQFACLFSTKVYMTSSEQRQNIHMAAVFANNFTNYMYTIADEILSHSQISFDILKPLINETAKKINDERPSCVQTGPASRNDKEIINSHLHLLNNFPDYKEIYTLLTLSLIHI